MNNRNYLKLSDLIGEAEDRQDKLGSLLHMMGQELKYDQENLDNMDLVELGLKYPKIIKLLFIALDYSTEVTNTLKDIDKQLVICDQGGTI
jgi:hypothetical protein